MSWDPQKALSAIRKCIENINENRKDLSIDTKYDKSLVTNIDKSNEAILRECLEQDGDLFLGEESVDKMSQGQFEDILKGNAYIVDPIDGTAPFAHKLPLWAISVGYSEQGKITNGCIVLPDMHEAYISIGDDVLFTNDLNAPLETWQKLPQPAMKWSVGAMIITGQDFTRNHKLRFKNPILSPGSAVMSFAALLSGKAIAYVGNMKLWDVAGSIPLLNRMGFSIRMRDSGKCFKGLISPQFFDLSFPNPTWAFISEITCTGIRRQAALERLLARENQ